MNIVSLLSAGSVLALLVSAAVPSKRDTASTIWSDIENATTCAGCEVRIVI